MFSKELNTLIHILGGSPFFMDLSRKDKESLVEDLVSAYPQLMQQTGKNADISSGIHWFAERFLK